MTRKADQNDSNRFLYGRCNVSFQKIAGRVPVILLLILMTWGLALSLAGCGNSEMKKEAERGTEAASKETNNGTETESSREVFAMDTYMTVTAYGKESEAAVEEAISEIKRLDALWSVGNENSEVSRLNAKGSLTLSAETSDLIAEALDLFRETDGAFDITIYPLMEEWGFTTQNYQVPSEDRIHTLLKKVDAGLLEYDSGTGQLTLPQGMKIDLGGIAKGYTSNHIMDVFSRYDIVSGLVSLGGNVQTYHRKPDGSLWRVGVENPDSTAGQLARSDYVGVLEVADKAIITSGGYERYFEENGKRYHHIIDPSTGYPSDQGLISVTIVSEDGCMADGLSTSLFVMGLNKSLEFWRNHREEFDAVFVDREGRITVTSGLRESFSTDLIYELAE